MGTRSLAEHRGDALRQLEELGRASVPNAAVLMDIHHHTLRKYIDDGSVEAILIGQRPWISKEEIERFRGDGKRTSSQANAEAN